MALLGKNRHYEMHGIQRRHFNSTAQKVGCESTVEPIIEELLAHTPVAIAEVQAELPRISHRVSAMPSWAALSRRPEYSVGCRRKQAKSRAFPGKFERAKMQPDRR